MFYCIYPDSISNPISYKSTSVFVLLGQGNDLEPSKTALWS